ncbi:uncharacterized protein LOC143321376 [Chaetodon auriga]|uniref:uncharacterized protein LOC143321376 n=1 Tax=Chaetodon auriga TaxID=39042 RepID=UPI00403290CE
MWSPQSCVVASVAACSLYLAYAYIYCSHKLLKTNVLNNDRLPSLVYLYMKYLAKALTRRTGRLYVAPSSRKDVVYTLLGCRLETPLLRRFCSAVGYGWDYPDTDFKDVPLCFPEFLCRRLLLMVLTDKDFRLSPAGLVHVRQSLKTLQPVDELKKGPFMLQVKVLEYRQTDAGVEVDICLTATARTGCPVWESVLTLLSKNKSHRGSPRRESESHPDEPVSEGIKQVKLRVPWTAGLQCVWALCDVSSSRLLSLPARLFGSRLQASPSLWMLSACLAEIEKHKGVGVITAPVSVTARFREPLPVPGRVNIAFWDTTGNGGESSAQGLSFHMQHDGSNISHVTGSISKS